MECRVAALVRALRNRTRRFLSRVGLGGSNPSSEDKGDAELDNTRSMPKATEKRRRQRRRGRRKLSGECFHDQSVLFLGSHCGTRNVHV